MDSVDLLFVGWGCILPLVMALGLYIAVRKYQEATARNEQIREAMEAERHATEMAFASDREKLEQEISKLGQLVADLRQENSDKTIAEWFNETRTATYKSEIEVETKFVYPMLLHLGYHNDNLEIRHPINIQVGRNANRGEADWVVWNNDSKTDAGRKALVVVEAKAQNQELTIEVLQQARSYAFALNARHFLCTNGNRIMIFLRGVEQDLCVLDCHVNDLPRYWSLIQDSVGSGIST